VAYDAETGVGELVADDGSTVLLEADSQRLVARLVELRRDRPDPSSSEQPGPTTVTATGAVSARGALSDTAGSHLELSCGTFRVELGDVAPGRPPRVGPFSARDSVRLLVVTPDAKGERRVALTTEAVVGGGSVKLPGGRRGLRCVLDSRWDATLSLPKKGAARLQGGSLEAVVDLDAARTAPPAGETEVDRLRRSLYSLRISGGLEIAAKGLFVRADEAVFDGEKGLYRLRGDPSVISRGSRRQEAREQVIRLADE
jgi:hypothetical protein